MSRLRSNLLLGSAVAAALVAGWFLWTSYEPEASGDVAPPGIEQHGSASDVALTELADAADDAQNDQRSATSSGGRSSESEGSSATSYDGVLVWTGKVLADSEKSADRPAAGALVRAEVLSGPERFDARGGFRPPSELAWTLDGRVGTDGRYRFDVPLQAFGSAPARALRLTVKAEGYPRSVQVLFPFVLPPGEEPVVRLDARLYGGPGPLLTGRVVDPRGEGIEGAQVDAFGDFEHQVVSQFDGHFAFPHLGGASVRLAAMHFEHGLAHLDQDVHVPPDRDVRAPDLVLGTGGRLAGRVTLPDGTPLPFHELVLRPSDAQGAPSFERYGLIPPRAALELEALPGAFLWSDAEGRFEARGLAALPFTIQGLGNAETVPASAGPYLPDRDDLHVVLERYRLNVVLVARQGALPAETATVIEGWSEPDASVHASLHADSLDPLWMRDHPPELHWNRPRSERFEVGAAPNTTYRLTALADGFRSVSRVIDVAYGDWDVDVRLELAPDPTAGTGAVEFVLNEPREETSLHLALLLVSKEHAFSESLNWNIVSSPRSRERRVELASGGYRAFLTERDVVEPHGVTASSFEFTVRAGETTRVDVSLETAR